MLVLETSGQERAAAAPSSCPCLFSHGASHWMQLCIAVGFAARLATHCTDGLTINGPGTQQSRCDLGGPRLPAALGTLWGMAAQLHSAVPRLVGAAAWHVSLDAAVAACSS